MLSICPIALDAIDMVVFMRCLPRTLQRAKKYGPYFYVMHSIMGFDKKKYHKLRNQGVSYSNARGSKSGIIKYSWKCYIGINSDFAEILASKAKGLT